MFECTTVNGSVCTSYTYWDVGLDFVYKVVTLDLRYWNTDAQRHRRNSPAPAAFGGKDLAGQTFVATLKFDTTLSDRSSKLIVCLLAAISGGS